MTQAGPHRASYAWIERVAAPRWVTGASAWLRHLAGSRAGVVGVFAWAVAEALVWPIIPDASLAALTAARPRRWAVLTLSTVAGSAVGGLAGWWAGSAGWRWPLPLTTPRMTAAVQDWLADGASALAHQPLSGVPYKVFVAAAPDAGVAPVSFAAATVRYRGVRFAATAVVTALVAALAWRLIPPRWHASVHVAVTAVGAAALVAALSAVVTAWS